jgi:hypothetical protein
MFGTLKGRLLIIAAVVVAAAAVLYVNRITLGWTCRAACTWPSRYRIRTAR